MNLHPTVNEAFLRLRSKGRKDNHTTTLSCTWPGEDRIHISAAKMNRW